MQAFRWYHRMLKEHPYLTNSATTGLVIGAGDGFAQYIERRQYRQIHSLTNTDTQQHPALTWQKSRTAILTCWGALIFSPFFTRFFHFLEAQPFLAAKTPRNITIRVLGIWVAAIPLNATYFVYTATVEHLMPVARFSAEDMKHLTHGDQTLESKITAFETLAATPASAVPLPLPLASAAPLSYSSSLSSASAAQPLIISIYSYIHPITISNN